MIRLPKPALAGLAGFVLVFAAACGGSSATTPPGGSGAVNPTVGGSVVPTVNANDPNSIFSKAISGANDVKSFHLELALGGTIKAAALQSYASGSGVPITSDVKLDGTSIKGDVDVANQAAHFALNVPGLEMLGGQPITGDLILINNTLYYKVSMLGPKYTKQDLSSLTSGLPIPSALPTPGASAMTAVTDELAKLQQQMQAAGITAKMVGVEQIGGQDAYHINVALPLDKINAEIAASSPSPAFTVDSASIDVWIYKATNQLAKLELSGASGAFGSLDFTLTITNYNQPVTIAAPAAADVNP